MDESGHRIVQQHPGTGIPHHTAHTLPHIGFVTMDGTPAAGRLALAERTTRKALPGIFQQRGALGTEPVAALPAAAIETDHPFRRFLFLFDTGHGRFSVSNDILRQSHIATCRNFRQRIAPTGIIGGRRRMFGSAPPSTGSESQSGPHGGDNGCRHPEHRAAHLINVVRETVSGRICKRPHDRIRTAASHMPGNRSGQGLIRHTRTVTSTYSATNSRRRSGPARRSGRP